MLISPPFLPARLQTETESAWIDRCMSGGVPGDGAFPVSFGLSWHGGLHLDAPLTGGQAEPVRAIADGEVVIARQASPQPSGPLSPTDPQGYGGWTDEGVVVIRHSTEIGEGPNAAVTFYSVYMHLSALDPAIKVKKQIYRKDKLGTAGQIYGDTRRRIHFEVFCDDANVRKFLGRPSGDLDIARDGRLDAVYGSLHFVLPAGTQFFDQKPLDHLTQAHTQPPPLKPKTPLPPKVALQPVYTSTASDNLVVVMRYACGEGAEGHRGSAFLSTLKLDGSTVGSAPEEVDAEYNLYTRATDISKAYPEGRRPAPSAVYELLRFGRVVNTPEETLTPADVPHWRKVAYPGGTGWVNLNATGVRKFSDADFPHWMGWKLIDDSAGSAGGDSRCDSATIKAWLDANADGKVTLAEAEARLRDSAIISKLSKTICKFPTEWDANSVEARWGWLKTKTEENVEPFNDTEFGLLAAHIKKLAFWSTEIRTGLAVWHWQPREFILWMRKISYLSASEIAQIIPRFRPLKTDWNEALARARSKAKAVNHLISKYTGSNSNRLAHLFSQIFIETDVLATFTEYSKGYKNPYGAFYGRGLMQLTWPKNFAAYGRFRIIANHTGNYADKRISSTSLHLWEDGANSQKWAPRYDPVLIEASDFAAGDSGGFYWVSKTFRGTSNINRVCDMGALPSHVGFCSWLINGGGNGYKERQLYFRFALNEFSDIPRLAGKESWKFPPLSSELTSTFPPKSTESSNSIQVDYARQIP